MKKVLLLGALLSTMAFGAPVGAEPSTKDIILSGKAIEPVQITSTNSTLNFGTVVKNKSKELTEELTITGTDGNTVTLTAVLSGTVIESAENVLKVGIGSAGTGESAEERGITLTSGTVTKTLYLTYSPTETGHTLSKEKVTLTATYE